MDIVQKLRQNRDVLLKLYDLDKASLAMSYGIDKWNNKQVLHHIADAEMVLSDRIKRAISRPKQVVWSFDQDAWADGLKYNDIPIALSRDKFLAVRNSIIYMAQTFYDSHGDNGYVHNETGLRTLKEEFDKVLWHAEGHISQIQSTLA